MIVSGLRSVAVGPPQALYRNRCSLFKSEHGPARFRFACAIRDMPYDGFDVRRTFTCWDAPAR